MENSDYGNNVSMKSTGVQHKGANTYFKHEMQAFQLKAQIFSTNQSLQQSNSKAEQFQVNRMQIKLDGQGGSQVLPRKESEASKRPVKMFSQGTDQLNTHESHNQMSKGTIKEEPDLPFNHDLVAKMKLTNELINHSETVSTGSHGGNNKIGLKTIARPGSMQLEPVDGRFVKKEISITSKNRIQGILANKQSNADLDHSHSFRPKTPENMQSSLLNIQTQRSKEKQLSTRQISDEPPLNAEFGGLKGQAIGSQPSISNQSQRDVEPKVPEVVIKSKHNQIPPFQNAKLGEKLDSIVNSQSTKQRSIDIQQSLNTQNLIGT